MNISTIIFIAIGLSMDAFAISVASGVSIKELKTNHALKIAIFFGGFQALMPLIGWLAGLSLRSFIGGVDHWIAFGLLSFIGGKMIYEAHKLTPDKKKEDPLNTYFLFLIAIATSVDALAVGLSLSLLQIVIAVPVIIIGVVTFILCFLGVFIGNRIGHFFENKLEIIGGVVLISIGVKILLTHL